MIKVQVQSDTKDLETLLQKLKNPRPALVEIGRMLVRSTQDRLRSTKQGPDGKPWAPWSMATLLGRLRKGTASGGILYDSGNLMRSIQAEVQSNSVIVGTKVNYASFLQDGTKNMPARPFVGVSKQDEGRINDILRKHLKIT